MELPAPTARFTPEGLELMPHQGQVVAAAAAGHRTFLLADEPGLGKTAEALLAAEAANAYPLLVVVPNVVKTNWAREAARWVPHRPATVVQGDGEAVDGFADIVRKSGKPVILVANKSEGKAGAGAAEAYELGLGDPIPISAEHAEGLSDLYDAIRAALPDDWRQREAWLTPDLSGEVTGG